MVDVSNRNAIRISMARTLQELESEVMQLSEDERLLLMHTLSDSLHESDPEIEKAWAAEAERRLDEMVAGKVKGIPASAVLADMRRRSNEKLGISSSRAQGS